MGVSGTGGGSEVLHLWNAGTRVEGLSAGGMLLLWRDWTQVEGVPYACKGKRSEVSQRKEESNTGEEELLRCEDHSATVLRLQRKRPSRL